MKILLTAMSLVLAAQAATAQSPAPVIVQPTSTVPAAAAVSAQIPHDSPSVKAAIKLLEQMKAANDEILSKQKAALERLDEMQQAADQVRIFAARG